MSDADDLLRRQKAKDEYVSGQMFDQSVYNLIQADEKAAKKDLDPIDLYNAMPNEEDLETPPEPLGVAPSVVKLPQKKTLKAKFPKKPIPYAIREEKVYDILDNWERTGLKPIFKYYMIASYLWAARVSEIIQMRQQDLEIVNINNAEFLQATLLTEKTRNAASMIRKTVVPFDGSEGRMVETLVSGWVNHFSPSEKIFDLSRLDAWRAMRKINVGPVQAIQIEDFKRKLVQLDPYYCYPHYLRHVRLSWLKTHYHVDNEYLTNFVGWADPRMASRYVHLDTTDMANMFIREIYKK